MDVEVTLAVVVVVVLIITLVYYLHRVESTPSRR